MRSRANRVAQTYLDNKEDKPLDELSMQKEISEALDSLYPVYIGRWLKNSDLKQITKMMYLLANRFNSSGSAEKILEDNLDIYRRRIILILKNLALSEKGSIKEEIYNHFKRNPTSDAEDIEDYTRDLLKHIVSDVKRQSIRWRDTV